MGVLIEENPSHFNVSGSVELAFYPAPHPCCESAGLIDRHTAPAHILKAAARREVVVVPEGHVERAHAQRVGHIRVAPDVLPRAIDVRGAHHDARPRGGTGRAATRVVPDGQAAQHLLALEIRASTRDRIDLEREQAVVEPAAVILDAQGKAKPLSRSVDPREADTVLFAHGRIPEIVDEPGIEELTIRRRDGCPGLGIQNRARRSVARGRVR